MCNKYRPPNPLQVQAAFGVPVAGTYSSAGIGPWQAGPIVRAGRADVGQWGLIPWFSTGRRPTGKGGRPISTNNCRVEGMATAPTFKTPWARGQRCLIPAMDYDEPYWGSGRNVWWRFARADGQPWALAGLWADWTDPATGEVVVSYTMLTQNCDAHPVLSRMHKPDPALPPDAQDKRAVVPIERQDWQHWLSGSPAEALQLVRLPPAGLLAHGPAEGDPQGSLPLIP